MDDLMYIGDKQIVKSILIKYEKIYGKKFARSLMKVMLKNIEEELDDKKQQEYDLGYME